MTFFTYQHSFQNQNKTIKILHYSKNPIAWLCLLHVLGHLSLWLVNSSIEWLTNHNVKQFSVCQRQLDDIRLQTDRQVRLLKSFTSKKKLIIGHFLVLEAIASSYKIEGSTKPQKGRTKLHPEKQPEELLQIWNSFSNLIFIFLFFQTFKMIMRNFKHFNLQGQKRPVHSCSLNIGYDDINLGCF